MSTGANEAIELFNNPHAWLTDPLHLDLLLLRYTPESLPSAERSAFILHRKNVITTSSASTNCAPRWFTTKARVGIILPVKNTCRMLATADPRLQEHIFFLANPLHTV
jgi:hypothetical protein